ncbi:MAG TPA: hypothetical protein VER96_11940 [Polyangiaceae bacterium]|nr:hypothetical protein [Polyangiaceae bacterium]
MQTLKCGSIALLLAACGSSGGGTADGTEASGGSSATGSAAGRSGASGSGAGAANGGSANGGIGGAPTATGTSGEGGSATAAAGAAGVSSGGGAAKGGASGSGGASAGGGGSGSTAGAPSSAGAGGLLDAKETELKAFPTAEGYGRNAKGGRGGRVVEVTNLNDSGAGSLRAAVEATGARTIVFNVSGIIALKSKLVITGSGNNGTVTVAGQTAPGKGIAIKNFAFGMTGGADVIMRFVRLRVGGYSKTAMDGMGMASADNTIYDHCSISWTIDEAFSSRSAHNITLQRTLISECLNDSYHYDDSTPDHTGTQPHGFAASISGNVGSFHHNLLAHCAGRNWSLAGGLVHGTLTYDGGIDIRNNVVYNWQYRTTDGGAHQVNFVNNYYKPGPASTFFYALNAQNDGFEGGQYYYFAGNVMPGHFDEASQDKGREATGKARDYDPWLMKPFFTANVTTQTAGAAYTNVLANVGANVPILDDHDKRVIQETRDGTTHYKGSKTGLPGLPDTEDDVGGYEDYPSVTRAANWDTDHDGISDAWEKAHGLNASDASDGNKTNLSKVGYTNLEMYLNELAGDFK